MTLYLPVQEIIPGLTRNYYLASQDVVFLVARMSCSWLARNIFQDIQDYFPVAPENNSCLAMKFVNSNY